MPTYNTLESDPMIDNFTCNKMEICFVKMISVNSRKSTFS